MLTVICHGHGGVLRREDVVLIPVPAAIFTIGSVREIRSQRWEHEAGDMKVSEEKEGDATDRAKLDLAVPNRPMLVKAAVLVVLGVIGKGGEDRHGVADLNVVHADRRHDMKRSDHSRMRQLSPRNAVVDDSKSIARSRMQMNIFFAVEGAVRHHLEHRMSSSAV